MSRTFRRRMDRGYTLVELIIVLTVVAILWALALSRLNYNRQRAIDTACNTNMAQLIRAAEAEYMDTGQIPTMESIFGSRYIMGTVANPHGGHYDLTWDADQQAAVISCVNGAVTVTFPPGHVVH